MPLPSCPICGKGFHSAHALELHGKYPCAPPSAPEPRKVFEPEATWASELGGTLKAKVGKDRAGYFLIRKDGSEVRILQVQQHEGHLILILPAGHWL